MISLSTAVLPPARPNNLMWNMTRKCNFRCSYCYFPHDASPITENVPVERVLELLEQVSGPVSGQKPEQPTGKELFSPAWVIGLTGGEPLLYPGFIHICQALTRDHCIGLDTNLSVSAKVREFAQTIDPSRVAYIYASLHIEERERLKGVDAFIRNVVLLQERGFKVIVNSVLHPTLVGRFPGDREYFARHGVEIIPRPFKGEFAGRHYPQAYGSEVKAIFADYPQAGAKMVYNFKGVPCHGGQRFIRMEPDGTVLRCSGDKTKLGNVLESVQLNSSPQPCQVTKCPCRGLDWVELSPEQAAFVEGLRLMVIGERDKARAAWEAAFALQPDMSNAVNNLGVLDWEDGFPDRAKERFQQALDIHPGHELYIGNLDPDRGAAPRLSNEVAPHGAGLRS